MKSFKSYIGARDRIILCIDNTIDLFTTSILQSVAAQSLATEESLDHTVMDIISRLKTQKDRLLGGVFKILVVGEFSTGKSTFLNALLQKEALPVGVRPTTATINIIRHADEPKVVVQYWGKFDEGGSEITQGVSKEISIDELIDYSTSLSAEADEVSRRVKIIKLYLPNEYCKNSVEILDTPGLASTNEHHEKITLDYLPNGHACIMLLNPNQPLSKSERDYLKLVRHYISKVLFVANKINLIDDDERIEVLEYMKDELKKELKLNQRINIFPLNAKRAAKDGWTGTGFTEFAEELECFLTSDEKAIEMLLPPARVVKKAIIDYSDNLQMKSKALRFSPEEFEKRMNVLQPQLQDIEEDRKSLRERFELIRRNTMLHLERELSSQLDEWQLAGTAFIQHWQGNLDELPSNLSSFLKESLAEVSLRFRQFSTSEIGNFTENTISRMNRIEKRIKNLQIQFTGSDIDSFEADISISSSEDDLQDLKDIGILGGGGFAIGLASALILTGPIGWIAGLAGGGFFIKKYTDKMYNKKLEEYVKVFSSESDEQKNLISRKVLQSIKDSLMEFEKSMEASLSSILQALKNSLDSIREEMELERSQIQRKRESIQTIVHKLSTLSNDISNIINEVV